MKRLVHALDKLREPSEPLEFLSETGTNKTEAQDIMAELNEYLAKHPAINALAAPQIGIGKRIFCIRFNDTTKYFINPIVTKKTGEIIAPETFLNMPDNEILIARPEEIAAVYYTDEFTYEENKFVGLAARIFDQMTQLLDGVLPDELGLVSNITEDGSLAGATDDEMRQYTELYKKFIAAKAAAAKADLEAGSDEEKTIYKKLKFTEDVINGRAQVYENATPMNKKDKAAVGKYTVAENNARRSAFVKMRHK